MSTFKLQNRIEDTGRVITGMVVTDNDHLLLCDVNPDNGKLVAAYYHNGEYMKTIDVPPSVTNNDVITDRCDTTYSSIFCYSY
jgi:hypothetical protein